MQISNSSRLCAALLAGLLLTAGKKPDEFEVTRPPIASPAPAPSNGSIFQASRGYAPLTSGTRAARSAT
jgi:flagellar L-ring protein precursor FlgH